MSRSTERKRPGLSAVTTWLYFQFWREAQAPRDNLLSNVERSFIQAQVLVRCFYAAMLYISLTQLQRWQLFEQLVPLNTLWPVAWVSLLPWQTALYLVLGLFVTGAATALIFTEQRWARILAFLGCLEFYALYYSFNDISHRDHLFVLVAFMLILLTKASHNQSEEGKRTYLLSFFGVQAIIFLTYMMTGLTKVIISARSFVGGGLTSFHPQTLVGYVANANLDGNNTLLGPLLIQYPELGFLLLTTVVFVELFAFYIAFRPSLHRLYGVFMVGMHIGIATTVGLFFSTHLLTVALFLVASPFVPVNFKFWATLHDIPMIGPFITALRLKLQGHKKLSQDGYALFLYSGEDHLSNYAVLRMLMQTLPRRVFFGTYDSDAFYKLQRRYPYLATPDSLVTVLQDDEQQVFTRSEAVLVALAASSGVQSYAFILFLLVPPPLLDWGYRLVAAPRRAPHTTQHVLLEASRQERLLSKRSS